MTHHNANVNFVFFLGSLFSFHVIFEGYLPFTVITKYLLYSLCCTYINISLSLSFTQQYVPPPASPFTAPPPTGKTLFPAL